MMLLAVVKEIINLMMLLAVVNEIINLMMLLVVVNEIINLMMLLAEVNEIIKLMMLFAIYIRDCQRQQQSLYYTYIHHTDILETVKDCDNDYTTHIYITHRY